MVKVETTEPGLIRPGLRYLHPAGRAVVLVAINTYLNEFCVGKDVDNIEDMWHGAYVSSYWRNGPVLNNALSGLDQALWDIKGKRAKMPVYQLLGGKVRFAIPCYTHANGNTPEAIADSVKKIHGAGLQVHPHSAGRLRSRGSTADKPDFKAASFGGETDNYMNEKAVSESRCPRCSRLSAKRVAKRSNCSTTFTSGCSPWNAINMIKKLEDYRPFFIEDPFSPENMKWFTQLRRIDVGAHCDGRAVQQHQRV